MGITINERESRMSLGIVSLLVMGSRRKFEVPLADSVSAFLLNIVVFPVNKTINCDSVLLALKIYGQQQKSLYPFTLQHSLLTRETEFRSMYV